MGRSLQEIDEQPPATNRPVYIGIDNGPSGSIGVIREGWTDFAVLQDRGLVKFEQNWTKAKGNISRLVVPAFRMYITKIIWGAPAANIMMERPMVNPTRLLATRVALRFLEAQLIVLEEMDLSVEYIDSKDWQTRENGLLPKGVKGTTELKRASKEIGKRMFPSWRAFFEEHGDADGMLIAEYCRRFFVL